MTNVRLVALQKLYEEKPTLVVRLLEWIDSPQDGSFAIYARGEKITRFRKKEKPPQSRIA